MIFLLSLAMAGRSVWGEETASAPPVRDAIPTPVWQSKPPEVQIFPAGVLMAVSAKDDAVQESVLQGLNHMHGGWDFEASRHFAAALKADPRCLMAHWGMAIALLSPNPESNSARDAVIARLLTLIETEPSVNGSPERFGTDLERGYAYGLVKYLEDGPTGAANAFKKIADKYPKEMQAGVFSALFRRGGFDELGFATPDQETAEYELLRIISENPYSTVPVYALLTIRAEAPDISPSLHQARKLCEMAPDYPSYLHLLGHYEWRSGNHAEAVSAFGKAANIYQNWMDRNQIPLADCPEWIRSESYRIIALASSGDPDSALTASKKLAAISIPDDRRNSPGARMLDWEAKTLPARIGHSIDTEKSFKDALSSLPAPDLTRRMGEHTTAHWWINGLRIALDGLLKVRQGKLSEARDVSQALTVHGEMMVRTQETARNFGERTQWLRAFRSLEVLASQLRAEIASAGPKVLRESAYNWLASAADRQSNEPMMLPPCIMVPMAAKLGDFHLRAGRPSHAIESYERALTRFPGNLRAQDGLTTAKREAGDLPTSDQPESGNPE